MEVTDPAAAAAEATQTATIAVTVAAATVEVEVATAVAATEGKFSFFPTFHQRSIRAPRQYAAAGRSTNNIALHDCFPTENILT